MSWTAPTTVVSGTLITSAWGNSDVRDNALELRATPANRCVAYHNTTQSVGVGTSALSLNSEDVDTATMHDTVTNNSRITIPSGGDGFYLVHGMSSVVNANNGTAHLHLQKNGTTIRSDRQETSDTDWEDRMMQVFAMLALVAGDYLSLAGQAASNTFTFGSATASLSTRLSVVGPLPPA